MVDYTKYVTYGKDRADLSLLFREVQAFDSAVKALAEPFRASNITAVAALDALGFVLGTAVALELGVGLILVRKGGKLPVDFESTTFVDYSGNTKTFEIAKEAIHQDDKILVVDEWASTGAQLKASTMLIKSMGASVVGASCFSMNARVKADPFFEDYKLHSLLISER